MQLTEKLVGRKLGPNWIFQNFQQCHAEDIEENSIPVFFGSYQQSTTTQNSLSSSESYYSMDKTINTTFHSTRSSRSGKTSSKSFLKLKFNILLDSFFIIYSNSDPFDSSSWLMIFILPSHKNKSIKTRSESLHDFCLNQLFKSSAINIYNSK